MPAEASHGLRLQQRQHLVAQPAARERERELGQQRELRRLLAAERREHLALGGEEVGPALEQRRRHAGAGERRQGRIDRRHLDLGGRIAAEQHLEGAARFAVRLARALDVAPRRLELRAHVDHVQVGVLAGVAPDLHQREQVAVDPDRLLAEREELARLDREVPELRRRRGERLARVGVVERDRLRVRLGGRALRAQPPPHVELPRHADDRRTCC